MTKKICPNCGVEFEPVVPWQKFHSDACKTAWHNNAKREQQEQERRQKQTGTRPARNPEQQ